MLVKKQQLELHMEQWTGSKLGKEYVKAVYCHPAYLTYMQSTSFEMPGWMKHKLESRLLGYADDTTLMAESEEELKSLLMKMKEESEKAGLKLNIQTTKIMDIQSHHFMANRWGKSENSVRFHILGLQNHCRQWLQPWNEKPLLLGRKAMTNLDSIFKSRGIALPTGLHTVKAMIIPGVMY